MSCKSFDDYHRRITAYGCQNGTVRATFVDTETKGRVYLSSHTIPLAVVSRKKIANPKSECQHTR